MTSETPPERRAPPPPHAPSPFPPDDPASELVYRDDLTGLHNRRALTRLFAEGWSGLRDAAGEISLLILDLDLFKEVNDTFGHPTGDEVLKTVAGLLRANFRAGDLILRYGGDEFVVVLPGAGAEESTSLAERTRAALEAEKFFAASDGSPVELPVSFSVGVASSPADGIGGEEILAAADRRLYEEKRKRRPSTAARRRGHRLALLLLGLAGVLWISWLLRPGPAGEPASIVVVPAPVPRTGGPEAAERLRAEQLQAEVHRLTRALADAKARGETGQEAAERRAALEATIRELELRLAAPTPTAPSGSGDGAAPPTAIAPPAAAGGPAPAPPAEPASTVGPSPPGAPTYRGPELLSVVRPDYPPAARRMRRTAVVELRVRIDASGKVVEAQALGEAAGLGFDEAAKAAALRAEYRPAERGGRAVESEARLSVVFELKGAGGR